MTIIQILSPTEIRARFKVGGNVTVSIINKDNPSLFDHENVRMHIDFISSSDYNFKIKLNGKWYMKNCVLFHISDIDDIPEIEPGMWAKDRNGNNWLAVKTSKNSTKIEWIKAPVHAYENTQYFLDNIVDLHDADNVYWDRNKQTQIKELQQKQQELAKELEALNQQIQALK